MPDRHARPRTVGLTPAVLLLALGLPASGAPPESPRAKTPELPLERMVGQRLSNFSLRDVATGKSVALYGFRGKLAVVLAFVGTDCPVGNLYAPRLEEIAREFGPKGVQLLGINSNAGESAAQVAAYAKEHGFTFPVLKDEGNVVADMALVERTCEVVVLDGMATVRYRGAVDDQYGFGTRKDAPTRNFLRDALREIVSGGRVDPKATPVVGCLLDRAAPKSARAEGKPAPPRVRPAKPEVAALLKDRDQAAASAVGNVTYAADVAPVVGQKCQSCHRPGEVGPFPLLSYDDARKHAAMIGEVVGNRRMPPWHADPRHGTFSNDRSLTPRERATILAWVEQGTPLGDPAKLPPQRTFPEGWTVGTPDAVFEIPKPITVPAQGTVEYTYVRVPTRFKQDVWVQAAEARPGDRQVVHHIIVYVDDHSVVGGDFDRRVDSHLCGYAPGDMPSVYPEGIAKRVPAGSDLVFQIHYTPNGKITTDLSKVGLVFAKGPVKHRAHTLGIAQPRFQIPAGADDHEVRSSFTFPHDAHLLSFMPHMHLRGKDFRYEVTFPDGRTEVLLSVPAYDFGWQSYYTLAESRAMPKGTRIDCTAHFDNSAGNPSNPDPSKPVRWGEQTWEEMMIGYIDYVDDAPADAPAERGAASSRLSDAARLLRRAAKPR